MHKRTQRKIYNSQMQSLVSVPVSASLDGIVSQQEEGADLPFACRAQAILPISRNASSTMIRPASGVKKLQAAS
jgi:hypothetical protein